MSTRPDALAGSERGVVAVSTLGGFASLFSAAACCVLPLAFTALGLGVGGLAAVVPYHWPLTIASSAALSVGWLLHILRRRACMRDVTCTGVRTSRATFALLCVATVFIALSVLWNTFLEAPLMAWFSA